MHETARHPFYLHTAYVQCLSAVPLSRISAIQTLECMRFNIELIYNPILGICALSSHPIQAPMHSSKPNLVNTRGTIYLIDQITPACVSTQMPACRAMHSHCTCFQPCCTRHPSAPLGPQLYMRWRLPASARLAFCVTVALTFALSQICVAAPMVEQSTWYSAGLGPVLWSLMVRPNRCVAP